jgi:oligopeptide transport system permease protein
MTVPPFVRRLVARLAEALLTLWLLVTLTFVLLRLAPGGPFDFERAVPPEVEANLAARFHLDQPLLVQYGRYLADIARGDLGPSFQYPDFTVNELIAAGLPVSALTGGLALLIAVLVGTALGAWSGWRAGSGVDRGVRAVVALGIATPKFVAAPLLILLFAVWLGWLPAGGWRPGEWRDVVLPVAALALPNIAIIARMMRASMLEVLAADYIRAARARGIEGAQLFRRHVLRPAFAPVLAYLSPALIGVLTGSTVVEQVFGIPGMGRYFVQGALNRDYTLVMGVALVAGVLIIAVNVVVDGLRGWLDPRVGRGIGE